MEVLNLERSINASQVFNNANRLIEAYHTALAPLCREAALPPLAMDILIFFANNPGMDTAMDVCRCRGWKPGIVSVHIDRLVNEGLLERRADPSDRRKTRLVCTAAAQPIIEKGLECQRRFGARLTVGMTAEDIEAFRRCIAIFDANIADIRKNGL